MVDIISFHDDQGNWTPNFDPKGDPKAQSHWAIRNLTVLLYVCCKMTNSFLNGVRKDILACLLHVTKFSEKLHLTGYITVDTSRSSVDLFLREKLSFSSTQTSCQDSLTNSCLFSIPNIFNHLFCPSRKWLHYIQDTILRKMKTWRRLHRPLAAREEICVLADCSRSALTDTYYPGALMIRWWDTAEHPANQGLFVHVKGASQQLHIFLCPSRTGHKS